MIKLLINLLLAIGIGALLWYFILPPVLCWKDAGTWKYFDRVCDMGTIEIPGDEVTNTPKSFSLDTVSEVQMTLEDDAKTQVTLKKGTPGNEQNFATDLTFDGQPAGFVSLIPSLATPHTMTEQVLIPYVANFGGTGSFVYLGLFSYKTPGILMLEDSYLAGDRILVDGVTIQEGAGDNFTALFDVRDRKEGEAMATLPSVPKRFVIPVNGSVFGAGTLGDRLDASPNVYKDVLKIETPMPQATVSSPIEIRGSARGWYFEASFPITVVDWDGKIIGEGVATASGDWMTSEFVPFTASIAYTLPEATPYKRGAIIFHKDNPSGLPENDDSFEMPINFK